MIAVLPAIVAFIIAALVVPLSMRLASQLGMLDVPDARKIHKAPIPRLGGIGIVTGVVIAVTVTLLFQESSAYFMGGHSSQKLLGILAAGAFVFAVGLVDDIRSVSARFKLVALIASAAMVCGSGVVLDQLVFGGRTLIELPWLSWLGTASLIIVLTVAMNFIDGLDGLAGGISFLCAAVLVTFTLGTHGPAAIIPLAMCGALLGFLFYNWFPAKTFMGDSGSMSLGFLLASSMVLANGEVGAMRGLVLPLLALVIPITDTFLTLFRRRYQQRRSLFSAERGHIHHRLLDRGLRHRDAVMVLLGVSVISVLIGTIALTFEGLATLGGLALVIPLTWGTFQLAGSVRTDEMVDALRSKRDRDRKSTRYRIQFEDLQLEFQHVQNFSQWWGGVCQSADRLDFLTVDITLPAKDGKTRKMQWKSRKTDLSDHPSLSAKIPIDAGERRMATTEVEVASAGCLESASERLALFTRLMTEHSLSVVRRRERSMHQKYRQITATDRVDSIERELQQIDDHGGPFGHLRVALVHDFLYTYCGAERVVEQLVDIFPHCDVFALFDFMPEEERGFLRGKPVTTSFVHNLPWARKKHRAYLPLMPLAIEQLDVSNYDLVISSSYLAAKGVITGPDQTHVCYCHSPARYAWDLQHQYLREACLGLGPKGMIARAILHYIRNWDVRSAMGVDQFIANSHFVSRRIEKVYRRQATVVHPPVDTEGFAVNDQPREDFYLAASRMVPYKRTDLIVRAFADMPDRKLIVIGEGPEMEAVRELAGPNVQLLGYQDQEVLVDHMRRAKALVFAAEEDFGIVPVEALACGTPVVAYGKGGVTESVVEGKHGVFYDRQTPDSLVEAIERFESKQDFGAFDPNELRQRAMEFSAERFREQIIAVVRRTLDAQQKAINGTANDESSRLLVPAPRENQPPQGQNGSTTDLVSIPDPNGL